MPVPCAAFRGERSRNGKGLSELKSGLQKYIRRGNTDMALWCAGELLSFRQAPEAADRKRVATNVLHRFMVITLEDVGDVGLWAAADECMQGLRGADDGAAARAAHRLTSLLAASPKSRACSHARAVAAAAPLLRSRPDLSTRYPLIAKMHAWVAADRRRNNRAQWPTALAEALGLVNPKAILWAWLHVTEGEHAPATGGRLPVWRVFDVLEAEAEGRREAGSPTLPPGTIAIARRWYKELASLKEAFLCWMLPCLALACDWPEAPSPSYTAPAGEPLSDTGERTLDDFVYDIHTRAGAATRGRGGLVRFALEGAAVDMESPRVNRVWRAFYEDVKRAEEGAPLEGPPAAASGATSSETKVAAPSPPALTPDELDAILGPCLEEMKEESLEVASAPAAAAPTDAVDRLLAEIERAQGASECATLRLIARAQIVTSRGKTDVYFATAPGSCAPQVELVVKGPLDGSGPSYAIQMAAWKRANGLPAARAVAAHLVPDRWPEGTPLGRRNACDRARPAWFLVAESLAPRNFPQTEHPPTKLWPATRIVDWARLPSTRWEPCKQGQWASVTHRERLDYVLALLARYVVGVGDLADRNFMRCLIGGEVRVVSFDEDARSAHGVDLCGELRKNKAALVRGWLERNWDAVGPAVRGWTGVQEVAGAVGVGLWRDIQERDAALALFEEPEKKALSG